MTLEKYTSKWLDATYILVFAVYLGMAEVFADFPTGNETEKSKMAKNSCYLLTSYRGICHRHLQVYCRLDLSSVKYIFGISFCRQMAWSLYHLSKYFFSHRPPLWTPIRISFDSLIFVRFFWCSCRVLTDRLVTSDTMMSWRFLNKFPLMTATHIIQVGSG